MSIDLDRKQAVVTRGTWTPAVTFATPGDLSVTYHGDNDGVYTLIDRICHIQFLLRTATFTHTSASGDINITGLPFPAHATRSSVGTLYASGWTDANADVLVARVKAGTSLIDLRASQSGGAFYDQGVTEWPTGATVILVANIAYIAAET